VKCRKTQIYFTLEENNSFLILIKKGDFCIIAVILKFVPNRRQGGRMDKEINSCDYSSQSLAYLGDCVYELYVRERLVKKHAKRPSIEALGFVTAHVQSEVVEKIVPMLSEEETDIYRRGRNIGHTSVPKSSTPTEYRRATGLETLFGWLYLSGKNERIRELFDAAFCDDAFTEKTECED